MQLKPILLTAALALASTTTVAAEWLPTSAEHNYAQYCQGKGSPTDDRYVCFQTASNSFAWQVSHVAQSRFKGYLGKDFNREYSTAASTIADKRRLTRCFASER